MAINVQKLSQELKSAGIVFTGCNEQGVVWGEDGETEIQNQKAVQAVISAHDPTPAVEVSLDEKVSQLEAQVAELVSAVEVGK